MDTRNSKQKEVGFAIHGLRAYIKALELNAGVRVSKNEFRYEIAEDRNSARIVRSADGTEIDGTSRTLADWAKLGKDCRRGLIGLRDAKEKQQLAGQTVHYTLNAISGEAYLSLNGQRLDTHPQTIAEWSVLGREVERGMFDSLNAALEFGASEAAASVRADMVRLGVIRERRTTEAASPSASN